MSLRYKAYVYLTSGSSLLVFDYADFPAYGAEVPGGTVDPGESFLQGAIREFAEETGITALGALDWLCDQDYLFDNELGRDLHRRRFFHARAEHMPSGSLPTSDWEHYEMTPNAGGDPIRFHLFWHDLADPSLEGRMWQGFEFPLPRLRAKLHLDTHA